MRRTTGACREEARDPNQEHSEKATFSRRYGTRRPRGRVRAFWDDASGAFAGARGSPPGTVSPMSDYETLRDRHQAEFHALAPEYQQRLSWDAERIGIERESRLRALLEVAKQRSPWHRERLAGIEVTGFREADVVRLPVMTKDDMMENLDGVFTDTRLSRRLAEEHLASVSDDAYLLDEFHVFASGGSSGRRGVFVWDWRGWLLFSLALTRMVADQRARMGLPSTAPVAAVAAAKASHMSAATTFQPPTVRFLPATLPIEEIVAGLNELQPVILRGYPTALAALAVEAGAGRLRIRPKLVYAHSEPLLSEARRALEEAWLCPVTNGYGTTEGACGASCAAGGGIHLNSDQCIFEFVDEAGRPVPVGEWSAKVYVTNLINFAQPLIRYELTDEMQLLAEPCPCGTALLRVAEIEGRSDDSFSYPAAVIHPLVFRSALGREPHIVDYQVRQTPSGAAIDVRTSGAVDLRGLAADIAASLVRAGLASPDVDIKEARSFDYLPSGKLKRFFPLAHDRPSP